MSIFCDWIGTTPGKSLVYFLENRCSKEVFLMLTSNKHLPFYKYIEPTGGKNKQTNEVNILPLSAPK